MMSLPTSVEPVNESLLTIGWLASGAPHSSPSPVSTLSTPGGRNSWHTSASSSTPSGASSAAFKTSVLPGAERRTNLEDSKEYWRVPRDDGPDHAEGLTPRVAQDILAEGNRLAFEFAAQAGEVAKDVNRRLRFGTRLGAKRVPGLKRDRARKLLDPRLERIGNPREKPTALPRNGARPGGKSIGGGFHGARNILGAATRDHGDRAPVSWILDFEPLARSAVDPFAANQHSSLFERGLVFAHFRASRHRHLHRFFYGFSPASGTTAP